MTKCNFYNKLFFFYSDTGFHMRHMVSEIIYDSLQVILRMFSRTTFQYGVLTMLNLDLKTEAVRVSRLQGLHAESMDAVGRGCMTSVSCVCHSSVTLDGI